MNSLMLAYRQSSQHYLHQIYAVDCVDKICKKTLHKYHNNKENNYNYTTVTFTSFQHATQHICNLLQCRGTNPYFLALVCILTTTNV